MDLESAWEDIRRLSETDDPANKVTAALRLVDVAFAGQRRRGGDIPMPMAVHSIRVGLQLERYGANLDTVLAGFCHDVLEDTNVTTQQVETLFGSEVLQLVVACSLDESIYESDHEAGNRDLVQRVARCGARAAMIKVVDILDNLATYYQVPEAWQQEMLWCAGAWLDLGRKQLGASHVAVKALEIRLRNIDAELGKKGRL